MDKTGLFVLIFVLNVLDKAHAVPQIATITPHEVSLDHINRILKRLDESESLTQLLIDRVEQLESRDKVQQDEIRSLKSALDRRSKIVPSEDAHAGKNESKGRHDTPKRNRQHVIQNTPGHSKSTTGRQDQPIRRIKSDIINVDASMLVSKDHLSQVQNEVQQPRTRQVSFGTPHIAFSATLSADQTHIGQGQPIIFDNVVTNFGNAYHNHLGSFIAPFQGTYVFSTTLLAIHDTHGNFALTKNGVTRTYIYHGMPLAHYAACSQTFILHLQQGDDVNIHNIDADKAVYGIHASTFSGFLLFEDETPEIVG